MEWVRVPWRVVLAGAVLLALSGEAGVGGLYHPSPVVRTRYGSLRGLITTPNLGALQPVAKYLGVPYAAPPVRKLRFMPPMSPLEWSGIRKAETLPPVCPQKLPDVHNRREALRGMPEGRYNYLQRLIPLLQNQSEDCLYLNIYAPVRGMDHAGRWLQTSAGICCICLDRDNLICNDDEVDRDMDG
ncbi:neuroligin-2 [Penaeus vannamei]|uniref:neuroligin-2 n=1 Tax=Penaeus vannamei TaxID=6689 RepID=UPI00387F931F